MTPALPDPGGLACPACRGGLARAPSALRCLACRRTYPQPDGRYVDLMPADAPADEAWASRQREMERSYDELAADPEHARLAYRNDLGDYAGRLARCEGRVLDVGGGQGLVRHYLAAATEYVVLEPSLSWLGQPWGAIADAFPCLAEPLPLVRGVAEAMPFPAARFDWALSFWSLNHARDPRAALAGIARVLRPGGRLLLSLDDVEPTWGDVFGGYRDGRFPTPSSLARAKMAALFRGWPVQPDHVRIRELNLRRWTRDFVCEERAWVKSYLTLVLLRT